MEKFTEKRIRLIRAAYGGKASDLEFDVFISHCKRLGLAPEAGQIFLIPRWDARAQRETFKMLVSLQGLRTVADRSGKIVGMDGPYFIGEDGRWLDHWIRPEPPLGAKVGILREGCKQPFWGFCRWDSFKQTRKGGQLTTNWQKMPEHMLAKCANAIALRAAFPDLLGGLYTDDEFGSDNESEADQGDSVTVIAEPKAEKPAETKPAESYIPQNRVQDMLDAFKDLGWEEQEIYMLLGCPPRQPIPQSLFKRVAEQYTKLCTGLTTKEELLGYVTVQD